MKHKSESFDGSAGIYEYAFSPVPMGQRKSSPRVFIVIVGYTVALSCFVIGAKVGYALPFWQAVAACIVGNVILMGIGISMGIMGYDTGLSTAFLVRRMFGKTASILVSLLIIFLCIYWVGMNGDSFARMIITAFPQWPVPLAVTAVLLVAMWGLTAAVGWRGLEVIGWLLIPIALVLLALGCQMIFGKANVAGEIMTFVPSGGMTVTAAVAAVTGNYVFGCIISPDLCRFAKSRKAVARTVIPAYTIGFILLNLCGVLVAQVAKTGDFSTGIVRLGVALPFLFCSTLGLWTTENNNIYGGSLAVQNLFLGTRVEGNLSHKLASWVIAGLAAAFAALRAFDSLISIVTVISVLVPPVAGMLLSEYFVRRRKKRNRAGWIWVPSWILGSLVGIWTLHNNFFIPPVLAMLTSAAVYLLLRLARRTHK